MYKVIEARGADATGFLQGQLTQDVGRLGPDGRLFAAWCSPKGRVIVTVRLAAIDGGIAMLVTEDMADRVVEMMLRYRFRAKVDLSVANSDPATLIEPGDADPVALIRAGIPTIGAAQTEQFTPHMLNLDRLDAVSFTKGCYTGQEIVARTEHRGRSKRRMMRYDADRDGIAVGSAVAAEGRTVGEVVNVAGRSLLAVTPVELHAAALTAGDVTLEPAGLPYAL